MHISLLIFLIIFPNYSHAQIFQMTDEDTKSALGLAYEEDKQPFENIIKNLLFVSLNDVHQSGFGKRSVDWRQNKKYFTDVGWSQYKIFIEEQKQRIKSIYSKNNAQSKAEFIYGSQKYSDTGSAIIFNSIGQFSYAEFDDYSNHDDFKISLSYTAKDSNEYSDFLINQWNVQVDTQ